MIPRKKTDEKIGEILLRQGAITKTQLEKALERQQEEHALLGEMLVKMGFVEDKEVAKAIIFQYGFPYIDLNCFEVNDDAVKVIPEYIARRYHIIPMDLIGDIITLAMANPLDEEALEAVEELSKKHAKPFIATLSAILEKMDKVYSAAS